MYTRPILSVYLLNLMLFMLLAPTLGHAAASAKEAAAAIKLVKSKDPSINAFFRKSYGYAVFPHVGKVGIGIGGAYGEGIVYRTGRIVGTAKLRQLSVGLQLGGQSYREIIFFQNAATFRKFTNGKLKLGAQVSAVAINKGAAAKANFSRGIAVFTMTKGGLMYEATIAGQHFEFRRIK